MLKVPFGITDWIKWDVLFSSLSILVGVVFVGVVVSNLTGAKTFHRICEVFPFCLSNVDEIQCAKVDSF